MDFSKIKPTNISNVIKPIKCSLCNEDSSGSYYGKEYCLDHYKEEKEKRKQSKKIVKKEEKVIESVKPFKIISPSKMNRLVMKKYNLSVSMTEKQLRGLNKKDFDLDELAYLIRYARSKKDLELYYKLIKDGL